MEVTANVYVKTDAQGRVLCLDGGYTTPADLTGWQLIDTGEGERFSLCQNHYLPKPLRDDRGLCRYCLTDGRITERTQAQIDADWAPPPAAPSLQEQLTALQEQNQMLIDCLLEMSEAVYGQ